MCAMIDEMEYFEALGFMLTLVSVRDPLRSHADLETLDQS